MKKLYFDIDNGEIVRPRGIDAPEYYVVLNDKNKIIELHTCFSRFNIANYGNTWCESMLEIDNERWTHWRWLMEGLRRYVLIYSYLCDKQDYEDKYKDNYVYLKFWENE